MSDVTGTQCVVTGEPDATIYTVKEVDPADEWMVRLEYTSPSGKLCDGGWMDRTLLKKPSKAQLAFATT